MHQPQHLCGRDVSDVPACAGVLGQGGVCRVDFEWGDVMKQVDRFDALVHALESVGEEIGVYPAAVRGCNDERDYEQRDGFKNGWNAALMEYGSSFRAAVERARVGISSDVVMLVAADVASILPDGRLEINFSDTWAWASSFLEDVRQDEIPEVARLYRAWGWCGLLYWATVNNPGLRSEFKDINRFIDFVKREEAFIKAVPSSSKRAFTDISDEVES